jgi:Family of unknown function (DUF6236)
MPQMLYYPGSTPPEEALFQAVLYWDSLSTISPYDWRRYAERTERGRILLELADRGLYEPISLLSAPAALNSVFAAERDRLLTQVSAEGLKPPVEDSAPNAVSNWYSVSRFPQEWTTWLVENKLATWREQDKEVWVDTKLRHLLFAVAADYLVGLNRDADVDQPKRFTFTADEGFFWAVNSPGAGSRRSWEAKVGALFPMPAPGTDIGDLIAFRERYKDERSRLVNHVGLLYKGLSEVHDENAHEVLQAMRRDLADAIRELRGAARASKMNWVMRGLSLFVAVGAGAAAAIYPSVAPVTITMPVVGSLAVNLVTNNISDRAAARQPYRYLQHATSAYGVPSHWPTK